MGVARAIRRLKKSSLGVASQGGHHLSEEMLKDVRRDVPGQTNTVAEVQAKSG